MPCLAYALVSFLMREELFPFPAGLSEICARSFGRKLEATACKSIGDSGALLRLPAAEVLIRHLRVLRLRVRLPQTQEACSWVLPLSPQEHGESLMFILIPEQQLHAPAPVVQSEGGP